MNRARLLLAPSLLTLQLLMAADWFYFGALSEEARHLTGYMFQHTNGKVYDPSKILEYSNFWFEPARPTKHPINDCLVHVIN